ncbi:AAA domain family protein [Babesia bovis T2Bo]|uniref:Rad50/SbcC-type AAA domain-containing protein n=1 Tax=Babesia bovis TaxID=5865 RepID=A7APR9_BABBO|nr:AAA domain family protein [Babesia bovis T2Bo]EDO08553.1 AAA domain family protein [Babesia bovis T2Bo]|eukprot:XP_001612121.1 hypothetical protein [Babesia bovis T2Bo]
MSTLKSLQIQGIRCFSPNNAQSIEFEKPLTLIVGPNGAGKTTIMECLKMGLCGILPPNADRGKSFIYDSKMSEQREVRAQITLGVETYQKVQIFATRNYSVTRERNDGSKPTFKTGESKMRVIGPDEVESNLGMKMSDIDTSLPSMMGLSRALIDSVVVCHQDESNWALDDLSKFKSKFDDLLETSRYTKALTALQKEKKEQNEAIKREMIKLEYAKAQITQVAELKNQFKSNADNIEQSKERLALLESELKQINETAQMLRKEYEHAAAVCTEIRHTKEAIERLSNDIHIMQQNIGEIYEESLDDMTLFFEKVSHELEGYHGTYNTITLEIDRLMEHMDGLHQHINVTNDKITNRIYIEETIKSTGELLVSIVADINKEMDLHVDSMIDEQNVNMYINHLENMSQNEEVNNNLVQLKKEIAQLEQRILDVTTKEGALNVLAQVLDAEMQDYAKQANELEQMKNSYKHNEVLMEKIKQELEAYEQMLIPLVNEREHLKVIVLKEKNTINGITIEDKNEVKAALNFLEHMLANDRKEIMQYAKDVLGIKADDEDLITKIKDFFSTALIKRTSPNISPRLDNIQFQQDSVAAIIQMINQIEDWYQQDGTEQPCSNVEPYKPLLKLVTSLRIHEYIAYYKSFLEMDSEQQQGDDNVTEVTMRLETVISGIQNIKSLMQKADETLAEVETELHNIALNIEKVGDAEKKYAELQSEQQHSNEEMEAIQSILETLKAEQQSKRTEYDELNTRASLMKNEYMLKVAKLTTLMERYKDAKNKLDKIHEEYIVSESDEDLQHDLKAELNVVTDTINQKRTEQRDLLDTINDQKQWLQRLEENITYKTKMRELEDAKHYLNALRCKLGPRSEDEIQALIKETNIKCGKVSVEIATLRGSLNTREETVQKLQQMLESDTYKNVHQDYAEIMLAVKSHSMAFEDLNLYTKTLEIKLHQYHSEKIEQINTVLKRVWREVYTGTNVDYIEIQSNIDTVVATTGLAPRSYNYRMVMVNHNGVEMDMRGRCSAGERVLASLILRITLTEAFCYNCNILALDEPTTNLDKENIASLETSLAKLVNDCSIDFQLILITHDEGFARKMALRCNCNKYFRLTKNTENDTVIEAVPFLANQY